MGFPLQVLRCELLGVVSPAPGTAPGPPTPTAWGPRALTSPLHHLVELALDVQLWVLRFHTLKLDGNFLTRGDVCTCQGWGKPGKGVKGVTLGQTAQAGANSSVHP